MALTKTAQAVQASASNTASGTTTSSWFATGYGVSGVAKVTNGGTGPTVACDFVIEVADDNGGTNAQEWSRQTADVTASGVYLFPYALGIGSGADWPYYRVKFTGNTVQPVTVQAYAQSTTAV